MRTKAIGHVEVSVSLLFEPRDLWIGAYWDTDDLGGQGMLTVYLTVIPCFPLRIRLWTI